MVVLWLFAGGAVGALSGLTLWRTVARLQPSAPGHAVAWVLGGTLLRWGLAAGLLIRGGWCIYRRLLYEFAQPIFVDFMIDGLLASVYTAMWAPWLHKAFLSMSGFWGISRPRYTYAGLERMKEVRV